MNTPINKTLRYCLAMSFVVVGANVTAGTATIESDGERNTLEFRGEEYLRMQTDRDGYMLHRNGTLYVVSGAEGEETVIDASAAMKMFGGMMPDVGPSATGVHSLRNTGRRETVAGVKGEVWIADYTDEEGRHQVEMVLSKDAAAREMRDAMMGFMRSMIKASGSNSDQADEMFEQLRKRGYGYLRVGNDMKVVALSGKKIDKGRFALPAEPMQMPSLGNFGAAISAGAEVESDEQNAQGSAGFSFGSIFQQKAERQQERAKDRTEEEVDKQTDNVVDKALDKAFNKLFGN